MKKDVVTPDVVTLPVWLFQLSYPLLSSQLAGQTVAFHTDFPQDYQDLAMAAGCVYLCAKTRGLPSACILPKEKTGPGVMFWFVPLGDTPDANLQGLLKFSRQLEVMSR